MVDFIDVSATDPRIYYTVGGTPQTDFDVPFVFFEDEDLLVYVDGVLKTLTTHYTVTGAEEEEGGTVTFVTAQSNVDVAIVRDIVIELDTHIPSFGPLDIGGINVQFSRFIAILQELESSIARSLHVSDSVAGDEFLISDPVANEYLIWNATGTGIESTSIITSSDSYAVASQSQAEAGVLNTTLMTPLRAFQASVVFAPATRTVLKALDTTKFTYAYLREAGREGQFVWKSGDYSTHIAADTLEGVYVKADAIAAASGAWVRVRTEGVYDVKWFGALGNNVANDYAAIQAAIDLCEFNLGGDVLFSQGGYLIGTGLVLDTPLVRLLGVGQKRSSIYTTTANINLITISAARVAIEQLSLYQQVQCGVASAIVNFADNAVQCTLDALDISGGYYCIRMQTTTADPSPVLVTDNLVKNCTMAHATGGASVYLLGAGAIFFQRCLLNQDWGVATPSAADDRGAHAVNTAYGTNDFVTLAGFILQVRIAGTSHLTTAPSLTGKWYFQDITDGTVTWRIVGNAAGVAAHIDSNCSYIKFEDCDMTGSYITGLKQTNNLGEDAPDVTRIIDCTVGATIALGYSFDAGERVTIRGCELQVPVGTAAATAIFFNTSFGGDAIVDGNDINHGWDNGIWTAHALGTVSIVNNQIFNCTSSAVKVNANVSNFRIDGNILGSGNTLAVEIQAGTSDNYIVTNNYVDAATSGVSDLGTGVDKYVANNI
jgi:hypothetical protein